MTTQEKEEPPIVVNPHPVGWYDPITRKFATSPTAFPRAAKIIPLYRRA